ncbi:MAG TPA: hypothetical protein VLF67_03150 [Candidatus Saccharimonas sp.]|nr:hypothetical protein [Candidatus Saccharimonas sp.]
MAGDVPTEPVPWRRLRIALGILLAVIAGIMLYVSVKHNVLWLVFFGALTAGAAYSVFPDRRPTQRSWFSKWLDKHGF